MSSVMNLWGDAAIISRRVTVAMVALLALGVPTAGGAFTGAQAESGARIYQSQCARCHGPNGEGKDDSFKGLRAPELVGPSALPCRPRSFQKVRAKDFRTVKDVYEFVSATMPADQPASLTAAQYWNVLAFVLSKNGGSADSSRLDAASSATIRLPGSCDPPSPPTGESKKP